VDKPREAICNFTIITKGGDYILPLKVDGSEIPGLPPTIVYLSLNDRSIDDVYQILLRKLGNPIPIRTIRKINFSQTIKEIFKK